MSSPIRTNAGRTDERNLPAIIIKGAAIGRKPENGPQRGEVLEDGSCYTLNCTEQHAVCFQSGAAAAMSMGVSEVSPTLDVGKAGKMAVQYGHSVRRLTPIECERLQGFPDNFSRIPYRNKPASQCPDGPRYKALGNSMAVPVMRWIGERIQAYEDLKL